MRFDNTEEDAAKLEQEIESASSKYHLVGCWMAIVFDPLFGITEYFSLPAHWHTLMVIRLSIALLSVLALVAKKRWGFPSFYMVAVPVLLIVLQNAYIYSLVDQDTLLGHQINCVTLFVAASMFALWKWYFSVLISIVSNLAIAYFVYHNAALELTEFIATGGPLLLAMGVFMTFLIETRYDLTLREIKAKIALQHSHQAIRLQAAEIERISNLQVENLQTKLSEKEIEIQKMRQQMAQDFHDEMGNKLATISMLSDSVQLKLRYKLDTADEEAQLLQIIQQTASEVFEGTKDFIWSVDAKSDGVLELFIYLKEFGERFFNQLSINFHSSYLPDINQPYRLAPLSGRQLILIGKEIMTNAAKHAQCQDFYLEMDFKNHELHIQMRDNGKGFIVEKAPKRGLHNIDKRIHAINGRWKTTSGNPGTDTTLIVPVVNA